MLPPRVAGVVGQTDLMALDLRSANDMNLRLYPHSIPTNKTTRHIKNTLAFFHLLTITKFHIFMALNSYFLYKYRNIFHLPPDVTRTARLKHVGSGKQLNNKILNRGKKERDEAVHLF